jgi:hypothetical protein
MSTLVLRHRFVAAIVICLSGTALLPFISLNTGSFGWQAFADAYIVFRNSFDFQGQVGELPWSDIQPPPRMQFGPVSDPEEYAGSYQLDATIAAALTAEPTEILLLAGNALKPILGVEARRTEGRYEIRVKAIEDDGSASYSDWRELSDLASPLEVEWTRALPTTRDGSLYLSQAGDLLAWVVDLDNDQAVAIERGVREFAGQPLLRELLPAQ